MEAPKHHIRDSQGGSFLVLNPHRQLERGGRHTLCHSLRDGGGECETGPPVGRTPSPQLLSQEAQSPAALCSHGPGSPAAGSPRDAPSPYVPISHSVPETLPPNPNPLGSSGKRIYIKNMICFQVASSGSAEHLAAPAAGACGPGAGVGAQQLPGPRPTVCCCRRTAGRGSAPPPGGPCPRSAARRWLPGGTCSSERCHPSATGPLPAGWAGGGGGGRRHVRGRPGEGPRGSAFSRES